MKKLILSLLVIALVLGACPVFAHGEAVAQHGGILQVVDDLSFELVQTENRFELYIEDHAEPVAADGITGTMTILQGSDKQKVALSFAADNRLQTDVVNAASGAKVVAIVKFPDSHSVAVRFTLP